MTNEQLNTLLTRLHAAITEKTTLEVSRTGSIKIGAEKVTERNWLAMLQTMIVDNADLLPLMQVQASNALAAFRLMLSQISRARPSFDGVTIQNYDFSDLLPFRSITNANHYVIFDTKKREITDLDYLTFRSNPTTASIEPITARIEFNPYSPETISFRADEFGRQCNHINTYKKPEWQLKEDIGREAGKAYVPDDTFFDFMAHLIPDVQCREFVYDWLHYALTDRCETYLVLNGAKGIGKNILSEHLCKPLIGKLNHKMAQPSALTSDFNSMLEGGRLIVLDEFKIDSPEKINKLKRYINEDQAIEKKGIDVSRTIKTFNSFIISNNDETDMKIAWDDRRFSVIDLTKVKLNAVWPKQKIDLFISNLEDEAFVRAIGYWLMYRTPKYTKFQEWKGDHFYALCYASFSEWQRVLVDLITLDGPAEIVSSDFRREYRRRSGSGHVPSLPKVTDFIKNYRHRGEWSLGDVEKQSVDSWIIQTNPRFIKQEVESEGDLFA
jgi:hypothetical protein